ncbi:hypothetical protein [Pedobacter sp. ASV28]|jgi:hypothetical protein|uniref:hypothetical protein n=1 Tax=Pedobacter sp. ASV28 TaxID=2795123 RepID=UPI0018EB885D|nr:hypothetical protein [Pedobacter sp. ASV28]
MKRLSVGKIRISYLSNISLVFTLLAAFSRSIITDEIVGEMPNSVPLFFSRQVYWPYQIEIVWFGMNIIRINQRWLYSFPMP